MDTAADFFGRTPVLKPDLKTYFQFATSGRYFMFEDKFYNQIDSVAKVWSNFVPKIGG